MKKLLFLFLCLLLFNCSSNDDTNEPEIKTFLENFVGTGWLNDDTHYYFRFINELNAPIEQWSGGGVGCYNYGLIDLTLINQEVTENLGDKLVLIPAHEQPSGYSYTITFTVLGSSMEMEIKDETPEDVSIDIYTFTKTSEDLDNLTICE